MAARYGSLPGVTRHYGSTSLGVLGSVMRSETAVGAHGAGYLYNDWQAGDDAKEFRGLVTIPPSGGTFFAYENGSFDLTGAADGSYSFTYRLYVDGADLGTTTASVTIGTVASVPVNTVAPTLTGSAVQGSTLTTGNGTWANSPTSYAYRWFRGSTPISGATSPTYVLQAGDVGSQIRSGVIATNATGSSTESLSAQTSVVVSTGDSVAPSFTGSITVGTVTSSSIQITWPTATDSVGVSGYETSLDGTNWTNRGVVALTYTFSSLSSGTSYTLRVRAKDAAGNVSAVLSAIQMTSAASVAPTVTAAPVITGSAMQDQLLTASTGSWANSPTSYTYRWVRGSTTISGATSSTYLLVASDVGSQIRVGVTAVNAFGSSTESLSTATAAVALPAIDDAAPVLLGTIGITFLNESGYTATAPLATDAYGVIGYQYRINAGTWTNIVSGRAVTITGRVAGVADALEMRAFDAALNYSSPLSRSVTPTPIGSYVFPGGDAAINMMVPKKPLAMLGSFVKQTDEVIDYDIDFTDWFAGRLDSIGAIDVIVDTGILVLGSAFSGNTVRVVLGTGVDGGVYKITVRVTTDAVLPIVREADFYVAVSDV